VESPGRVEAESMRGEANAQARERARARKGKPLFMPPSYNPENPIAASYVRTRQPQWKVHSSLAKARAAAKIKLQRNPRGGVIYILNNNRWEYLEKIDGPDAQGAATPAPCGACDEGYVFGDEYLCDDCRRREQSDPLSLDTLGPLPSQTWPG
jgi:hypothetical protein